MFFVPELELIVDTRVATIHGVVRCLEDDVEASRNFGITHLLWAVEAGIACIPQLGTTQRRLLVQNLDIHPLECGDNMRKDMIEVVTAVRLLTTPIDTRMLQHVTDHHEVDGHGPLAGCLLADRHCPSPRRPLYQGIGRARARVTQHLSEP